MRKNTSKSNKQKGTRRGKGMEQKKGAKGIAANYITRTKAIKKLQITLKDFRRLCILKGIFPRDPKKKAAGADKTYFHVKDIKFLQHEPLLQKFRDFKVFLRKFKKAKMKQDASRMEQLKKTQPEFTLDHLVKERYPQFIDALRDLDDALSMIYLFAALPAKTTSHHTPERAAMCQRLVTEWETYLARTHTLKRVFVSIKGIYYQAEILNATITWLVPHKFSMITPSDVDYRVMLTFLQFYETLLKFVNFKLYHDIGLHYPPVLDEQKDNARAGLSSVHVTPLTSTSSSPSTSITSSLPSTQVDTATSRALQKSVDKLVNKLKDTTDEVEMEQTSQEDEIMDDFEQLNGQSASTPSLVFAGLTFLISREVPQESLELVIRAGGGSVLFESHPIPEGTVITHQIVDRPTQRHRLLNREYIQPQWVYDSFNIQACVPVAPYGPGIAPPPHLSPFINDEAEGYVPKQRTILKQWRAAAAGEIIGPTTTESDEGVESTTTTMDEETLEQQYEAEMEREKRGLNGEEEEDDDDDDDQEEGEEEEKEGDQDDNENENEADSSDEEEEVEEKKEKTPATKKKSTTTITGAPVLTQEQENQELAKMMMGKKQARAYKKITAAITHKSNRAANLAKRAAAAESGTPIGKKQKAKAAPASQKSAKKPKFNQ